MNVGDTLLYRLALMLFVSLVVLTVVTVPTGNLEITGLALSALNLSYHLMG